MQIETIEINNFRVYYGLHTLHFATDAVKNITLLAGNNGYGKTSFLTSLVWCLYGKLMADVDSKYRQDIQESGGYLKYCDKLMNRLAIDEGLEEERRTSAQTNGDLKKAFKRRSFGVTIKLSGVMLPATACKAIEITRTFNFDTKKENIDILIDGRINELTRDIGSDIFINDFILPKEIAKFFFFDAEKIVALAEIKHADEKKFLSQAYSEVLGIKKYIDLRSQLQNVRLRLREKAAIKADRDKLERFQKQLIQNNKMLELFKQQEDDLVESINKKRLASDKYQEKLIREGSTLSLNELKELRIERTDTFSELQKVKQLFNELLELAPLAIAANKMNQIKQQLEHEANNSPIANALLKRKFAVIENLLISEQFAHFLSKEKLEQLRKAIKAELLPKSDNINTLLDFTPIQQNDFLAIYDHIKRAYSKSFKQIVADQKRLNSRYNKIQRKLTEAESKEKDPVIIEARTAKAKIDQEINVLDNELTNIKSKVYSLMQESQNIGRQTSELAQKVKIEEVDKDKDLETERLIATLDKFIQLLKTRKKESLERNLLQELKLLMHKDFVHEVRVILDGELIDIELYDQQLRKIDKEGLSKGEQQLYATALLKALVDESNIRFPIFIDSPLQKFDRSHSENIINKFYPNISGQVILLPLLQKELNEAEYRLLQPKLGQTYLLIQKGKYTSSFERVKPTNLFNVHGKMESHV